MSDYLHVLMQRSTVPDAASVRPRVRARFEPAAESEAPAIAPAVGLHSPSAEVATRPFPSPVAPRWDRLQRSPSPLNDLLHAARDMQPGGQPQSSHRTVQNPDAKTSGQPAHPAPEADVAAPSISPPASPPSAGVPAVKPPPEREGVPPEPFAPTLRGPCGLGGENAGRAGAPTDLGRREAAGLRGAMKADIPDEATAAKRAPDETSAPMRPTPEALAPTRRDNRLAHDPTARETPPAVRAGDASQPETVHAEMTSSLRPRSRPGARSAQYAAPPRWQDPPAPKPAAPVIRVTIGRVEVRAKAPKPPARTPSHPPPPRRPVLSLGEYLNQREEGM